jgi:hypothetical protein
MNTHISNSAVDIVGEGRGAVLLSDDGHYPDGMIGGDILALYDNPPNAVQSIYDILWQMDEQKT